MLEITTNFVGDFSYYVERLNFLYRSRKNAKKTQSFRDDSAAVPTSLSASITLGLMDIAGQYGCPCMSIPPGLSISVVKIAVVIRELSRLRAEECQDYHGYAVGETGRVALRARETGRLRRTVSIVFQQALSRAFFATNASNSIGTPRGGTLEAHEERASTRHAVGKHGGGKAVGTRVGRAGRVVKMRMVGEQGLGRGRGWQAGEPGRSRGDS